MGDGVGGTARVVFFLRLELGFKLNSGSRNQKRQAEGVGIVSSIAYGLHSADLIMACSALCLCVEATILVESGLCFLMTDPSVRRAVTSFTSNLCILEIRIRSELDLTLQIYSYDALGTGLTRHPHIPESVLIFFRRNSRLKDTVYSLGTIQISRCFL